MPTKAQHWEDGHPVKPVTETDGSRSEQTAANLYGWDATAGAYVKLTVDHATGNLNVTGGSSGGGGAVTVADGADVAQGTTTDASTANTVVGLLKAIKAAVQGTLTVATHAVTQSGVWTVARSWTLSSATDSVNVGNFPASQTVAGTVTVQQATAGNLKVDLSGTAANGTAIKVDGSAVTQPISGSVSVSNFPGTQAVSGTVTANQGSANATPWNDNLAQVGGSAIALKALPTNGTGQAALPVWNAAIQMTTYDAGARAIVTGALTAGTAKAVLSIEHSAAATKNVRIRRIIAHMLQTTALSGIVELELHYGTAASSAGTVRTPTSHRPGDPAAEAVVKTLPTIVAATVADTYPLGGFSATTALYSPPVVVYDWQEAGETKPYTLRAGVLEAFVLNVISSAAHNLTMAIAIDFTESDT